VGLVHQEQRQRDKYMLPIHSIYLQFISPVMHQIGLRLVVPYPSFSVFWFLSYLAPCAISRDP